jgi:hypothetical protein
MYEKTEPFTFMHC